MKRQLLGVVCLGLLVGCQNGRLSDTPVSGPSFNVSEARFGGGNPDLFFASPLGATPQPGDANFDVGGANGALVPYVRICETDGAASPAGCVTDVTQQVTGSATGLAMTYGSSAELYQVNWSTNQLNTAKSYRIEIWGLAVSTAAEKAAVDPRWLFGWRDISNSPSVASCSGGEAFCLINYGRTIPLKVRIEQYVFCPVARNCAVQFVSSGNNANLEAKLNTTTGAPSAQLFVPAQNGTDFALAFEPCTAAEDAAVNAAIDIPTFGPCLKTETTFTGTLGTPAIVSLCSTLDPSGFDLPVAQREELALHHFTADLSRVQALPEAWQCTTPTSGVLARVEPKGLRRFAQAVGQKVRALVTPRSLMAAPMMIDRGGGGEADEIASFFKLALPAKVQYEVASDASQSGLAGSPYTLRAKVTDLFGNPVKNARVHWSVVTPPSEGATVLGTTPPAPTYTDVSGIAQNTVQLSASTGFNVFHAFGRGIADSRSTGCTVPPSTPASCNGPRTTFDPFLPFHMPEFDAVGSGVEGSVNIAEGTLLPFTVFGCSPGRGSATIDGNFSSAEWACARTYNFSANVSGGSTPATLYVMNDGTNLYLAVRLQRNAGDKVNTLQFNFDNNNSWNLSGNGAAETGDDILSLDAAAGFVDAFLTLKCTTSGQSSCWSSDVSSGGSAQGSGQVKNVGGYTTYEISHPLNTADDAHDYSLIAGGNVGLFLTLQTGSGAAGNTQWPAFRRYQQITILP